MTELAVRIVGTTMPRDYCRAERIEEVGIWCRKEIVDRVPTTEPCARFDLVIDVVRRDDGGLDFRGPYVKGKRGERHLALSWGRAGDGGWETVRAAKLRLFELEDTLVEAALDAGALRADLDLSDERGAPVCATVRAPRLTWEPGAR